MNIGKYSKDRVYEGFQYWSVPESYATPMFHYLIYGWDPGSFFRAVLANDFIGAMQHSHPANTISALKTLVGWMEERLPKEVYGSYEKVDKWTKLSDSERQEFLEKLKIIYSEKEELWMTLKGIESETPMLF